MLLSQNAYAKKHGISAPRVSAMKANGQLVMRPHPSQKNKDGTPVMMVDEHASDVLNGRAKIVPVDINAKPEAYKPEDDILDETDIQASRARKEFYLSQNEKLKFETESGKWLLKDDVEQSDFQKARITRDNMLVIADRNCDILSVMSDPHEIKLFLRKEIIRGLEQAIKELSELINDE